MRLSRLFVMLSLAMMLPLFVALAQFRAIVGILNTYDDNTFRNNLRLADNITTVPLSLEYQPPESNFTWFVGSTASFFREFSNRRYFANSVGLSYAKPFGEQEENAWYAGGTYFFRLNKQPYNFYDFRQVLAYANAKYYLDFENGLMTRMGYRFRYRAYANLDELSYSDHSVFIQFSKFLESKTTLIAELQLGNKLYISSPQTTLSGRSSSASGGMMGSGEMWGERVNTGMGSTMSVVSYDNPATTQLTGTLRVAQSLTSSTGLSLQYLARGNISPRTRFISNGGADYLSDEELWDDPYGYESNEWSLTLTQVLPWEMTGRAVGESSSKLYSRSIFLPGDTDVPTGPSRADKRFTMTVEIKKSFDRLLGILDDVVFSLGYFYLQNESNDTYYRFRNNSFSLGVSKQF